MAFLLVKILSLLAAAALFGSALTWWSLRRRSVDVTEEYARSHADWAAWRDSIEDRLSRPMAVDPGQLHTRLDAIEGAIRNMEFRKIPAPDLSPVLKAIDGIHIPEPLGTDLTPVMLRLNQMDDRIRAIPLPELPASPDIPLLMSALKSLEQKITAIKIPEPQPPDFGPIAARLRALEEAVHDIRIPAPQAPADLAPVLHRIGEVERQIKAIQLPPPKEINLAPALAQLAKIEETVREFRPMPSIDLGPVQARIDETARAVRAINIPAPKEPDLAPVVSRLGEIERRVAAIRMPDIPAPLTTNLDPVLERLQAIERRLAPEAERQAAARVRPGSRNLLLTPEFGKPDDLTRIKGVAGVLEKMLHNIGVYYFWQIAEWDREDVAHVDGLLTAFKGRVERDHWVRQCIDFANEPASARKPQAEAVTA